MRVRCIKFLTRPAAPNASSRSPWVAGVKTGFSGDADVRPPHEGAGGGSGAGRGGDSAGAGGGLGKVLGGVVSVSRIDDGSVVGEARTDSDKGLVTITLCEDYGPLLVTLKGATGGLPDDSVALLKNGYLLLMSGYPIERNKAHDHPAFSQCV
ncbi:MAG: hypothetical protein HY308_03940 [Gammaproteobacteria bacterium]|nr:hypothetical protein [Gammaproteobacteria bacterium]